MKKLVGMMMIVLLAACQHHVPPPAKPLTFRGEGYRLNVARISVMEDFEKNDPNASYTLAKELSKWADTRLSAGGTANNLEVHITDAAITKKALPKKKTGIEGYFTKEQTEELSGRLAVDLKLYTPERTLPAAFAQVSAELSRTIREDASLEERKAIHRQIVQEIMQEVDQMLDEKLRNYFSKYLM